MTAVCPKCHKPFSRFERLTGATMCAECVRAQKADPSSSSTSFSGNPYLPLIVAVVRTGGSAKDGWRLLAVGALIAGLAAGVAMLPHSLHYSAHTNAVAFFGGALVLGVIAACRGLYLIFSAARKAKARSEDDFRSPCNRSADDPSAITSTETSESVDSGF